MYRIVSAATSRSIGRKRILTQSRMTTRGWSMQPRMTMRSRRFWRATTIKYSSTTPGMRSRQIRWTVRSDSPSCVSSVEGSRPPSRTRARWNRTSPSSSPNKATDAPISNRFIWLGSCIQSSTIYSASSNEHPCLFVPSLIPV
jgi:hypothetical protein